ncbi:MAG: hypothetical protein VB082_03615 [Christensenella sp.]|nr:hypothetical protein [Christensenella sp.]
MQKIEDDERAIRLMRQSIKKLGLDLQGMTVLTEAASGSFIVTPLIAALSGARKVYAVVKDTGYGTEAELEAYLQEWKQKLGLSDKTVIPVYDPSAVAGEAQIVTNLRALRPIGKEVIGRMPKDGCISLMMETWEFRKEDLDLSACKNCGVPVLGTNEYDERLHIIHYVGMIALKLLMERGIEIYASDIVLIASGKYAKEITTVLEQNGAVVHICDPVLKRCSDGFYDALNQADALVVAEQDASELLISEKGALLETRLFHKIKNLIHIAGNLDYKSLKRYGIIKFPSKEVEPGYMTVTTGYVGLRPVIDLHTAGLKVGQAMVEGLRRYHEPGAAKEYALKNSPAMEFSE